jgi:hypothetical protein
MHGIFDQFAKLLVSAAVAPACATVSEYEVQHDAQRADLLIEPAPARLAPLDRVLSAIVRNRPAFGRDHRARRRRTMGHDRNRGKDLEATREALASWRRLHGGRGRPIPAALWSDAAEVARANGVAETARALRLDPKKLAKLVEGRVESGPRSSVEPAGFVQLGSLGWGGSRKAALELVGREGDRVRVEIVGDAGGVVDLVALARAFWSRGA